MNILVVHEVSYLKKVVYEYHYLTEGLAACGHHVTVIDYDADGDGIYSKTTCSRTGQGSITLEHTPYRNLPMMKYFSGRRNYKKMLLEKLERHSIDVVLLYSVFINGTNTIKLCQQYGIPVVYRVLDVYHKIRKNALIALPLYLGEKFIYKNADIICVLCDNLAEYVSKMTRKKNAAIEVIHHGVDTSIFYPQQRDKELAGQYHIQAEDKVALFLGTVFDFCGLDIVIEHFHQLKQLIPSIKIMIVGDGESGKTLQTIVQKNGWDHQVIFTGFRPYQEVPRFLSLADVTLNPFVINNITRDIIPTKIVQYLACGKPVICSTLPNVVKSFPEKTSGIVYGNIQQPERFITLLAETVQNAALLSELSRNALQFIQNHFTINQQIAHVEQLLIRTVEQKRRSIA